MKSILARQLKKYVIENYGKSKWIDILEKVIHCRPVELDSFDQLLYATENILQVEQSEILTRLGNEIAVTTIKKNANNFKPKTNIIDFLCDLNKKCIAKGDEYSYLSSIMKTEKKSHNEVIVNYMSRNHYPHLLEGILEGTAHSFKEKAIIECQSCRHGLHENCTYIVKI